jgi:4-amino-4-deoxy-L-arabinose transferase-like glycosyltransferase
VLGTATVVLIALLGRRLGGTTVGLVAGALAAIYPALIAADASVMSETLYLPLVVLVVLATLAARRSPTPLRWLGAGALSGLAILTRGDALVLLVSVVVASAVLLPDMARQRRAMFAGLALVGALAVVSPWLVRNQRQLGTPSLATLDAGSAIAGTNCRSTYYGSLLGSWDYQCTVHTGEQSVSEVALNKRLQHDGVTYATDHGQRVPIVVGARILRQWGLWNPVSESHLEAVESRNNGWQLLTWTAFLPIALLAIGGLVTLRRRGVDVVPLLGVLVGVTISGALTYGKQRLRIAAEPVLLVAAAAALVEFYGRLSPTRPSRTPQRGPTSGTVRPKPGRPR